MIFFAKKTSALFFLFFLLINILFSQEKNSILFIGDSFFKNNYLLDKISNNYLKVYDTNILLDSSLVDGMNCIRQIQNKESLQTKLKNGQFKYIVLQSPSLLKPGIYDELCNTINKLQTLCPSVEQIILVPLNECVSFPNYKCANINGEIQCNIYQTCNAEHDTVLAITTKLTETFNLLEALPFSELKRKMKKFSFPKKDDIYGHPSKEIQEILARCFLIWINKDTSLLKDEVFIQKMTNRIFSLSQEDSEEIMQSFISIIHRNK